VVRHLLEAGHEVRALVRPGADTRQLEGLPVERVIGDLSDGETLRRGMTGCQWVFHVAALYSYWGPRWEDFFQANVEGTRRMLEAARLEKVDRVVYTSSVATLGFHRDHTPATEDTPSTLEDRIGPYQRSKFLAEEVVRDHARQGLPAVIVNPSTPVGAGDHKPTPTGQIIVDMLKGRMFGYVDTGLNIVGVENVAAGHLLAAERAPWPWTWRVIGSQPWPPSEACLFWPCGSSPMPSESLCPPLTRSWMRTAPQACASSSPTCFGAPAA